MGVAIFGCQTHMLVIRPLVFVVTDKPEEPAPEKLDAYEKIVQRLVKHMTGYLPLIQSCLGANFRCGKQDPANGVCSAVVFRLYQYLDSDKELEVACLKNFDSSLHAMPNLNQIHSLIEHYGPTVFFHRDEVYLPSSVLWFFKKKRGASVPGIH
ncbi:hypothetical protein DVH24_024291 [Malus domestica]|uniref:Uncharacterized protein n=1 Tax=Malus domestica TaxID=3750 RepID=A0A498JIE6_MALDO|nr:hypothetical protein DVH24_024291 [Malus domestica]